ncbi:hypothetical protein HRbin01_00463 [archaeon HR01]|nr:hypothetical protein HRbin01_00463 [archaeon HR01]
MREEELEKKLEELYSLINRARFYESIGDYDRVEGLRHEYRKMASQLKLSEKEAETMADDLDDYYVAGRSGYGDATPMEHWIDVVAKRFKT